MKQQNLFGVSKENLNETMHHRKSVSDPEVSFFVKNRAKERHQSSFIENDEYFQMAEKYANKANRKYDENQESNQANSHTKISRLKLNKTKSNTIEKPQKRRNVHEE